MKKLRKIGIESLFSVNENGYIENFAQKSKISSENPLIFYINRIKPKNVKIINYLFQQTINNNALFYEDKRNYSIFNYYSDNSEVRNIINNFIDNLTEEELFDFTKKFSLLKKPNYDVHEKLMLLFLNKITNQKDYLNYINLEKLSFYLSYFSKDILSRFTDFSYSNNFNEENYHKFNITKYLKYINIFHIAKDKLENQNFNIDKLNHIFKNNLLLFYCFSEKHTKNYFEEYKNYIDENYLDSYNFKQQIKFINEIKEFYEKEHQYNIINNIKKTAKIGSLNPSTTLFCVNFYPKNKKINLENLFFNKLTMEHFFLQKENLPQFTQIILRLLDFSDMKQLLNYCDIFFKNKKINLIDFLNDNMEEKQLKSIKINTKSIINIYNHKFNKKNVILTKKGLNFLLKNNNYENKNIYNKFKHNIYLSYTELFNKKNIDNQIIKNNQDIQNPDILSEILKNNEMLNQQFNNIYYNLAKIKALENINNKNYNFSEYNQKINEVKNNIIEDFLLNDKKKLTNITLYIDYLKSLAESIVLIIKDKEEENNTKNSILLKSSKI